MELSLLVHESRQDVYNIYHSDTYATFTRNNNRHIPASVFNTQFQNPKFSRLDILALDLLAKLLPTFHK